MHINAAGFCDAQTFEFTEVAIRSKTHPLCNDE
jgi:hypothetical protein